MTTEHNEKQLSEDQIREAVDRLPMAATKTEDLISSLCDSIHGLCDEIEDLKSHTNRLDRALQIMQPRFDILYHSFENEWEAQFAWRLLQEALHPGEKDTPMPRPPCSCKHCDNKPVLVKMEVDGIAGL